VKKNARERRNMVKKNQTTKNSEDAMDIDSMNTDEGAMDIEE
jgi:hypothetical protein